MVVLKLRLRTWRVIVCCLFSVLALVSIGAEISTAVTLQNFDLLSRQADESFALMSGFNGSLDFNSLANRNVKGELQIDAFISDRIILDIPRAYLKIRFPAVRITAGKTALAWGEGFFFNAGDVIFNGMSLDTNLAASVLRDNTITQLLLTRYLGRVSFVEVLLLPFPSTSESIPGLFVPRALAVSELAEGGRLVLSLSKITLEAGYLYRGNETSHNPYLALNGSFFGLGDFSLAASCSIIHDNVDAQLIKDSLKTSGGISSSFDLGSGSSLTLRLEAGVFPFAQWKEIPAASSSVVYGIYLFPEVSYAPADNVSFQLRSLISPVDTSGTFYLGANWNVYQGLTLGFLTSFMLGEEDDKYGWGRANDLLFMFNVEYVFGN